MTMNVNMNLHCALGQTLSLNPHPQPRHAYTCRNLLKSASDVAFVSGIARRFVMSRVGKRREREGAREIEGGAGVVEEEP